MEESKGEQSERIEEAEEDIMNAKPYSQSINFKEEQDHD